MVTAVTNALGSLISWISIVIGALVGEVSETVATSGAFRELLPLFAITIAVSLVMLGIKVIRGFTWGA